MEQCRNPIKQGRRHRFWTGGAGLFRKGALGGRGPFLSEPTFLLCKIFAIVF